MEADIRTLVFMHLAQDLDLLFPLFSEAKTRKGIELIPVATDRLAQSSARVKAAFASISVPLRVIPYVWTLLGIGPSLKGFDAVLTAAESNARPHWVAYRLTRRANREGLKTLTLQHGFEQPGLTYFDEIYRPDKFRFASKKIFIWGTRAALHEKVPQSIRSRCETVGWPKEKFVNALASLKGKFPGPTVLVSENLHRSGYDEDFRRRFVTDLEAAVANFPRLTFVLHPHPTQRWLAIHHEGRFSRFENFLLADPKDPAWEPYTATALVSICDGVITTPSTVALDAAMVGRPVAVAAYGLETGRYAPLSFLSRPGDWTDFLNGLGQKKTLEDSRQRALEFAARWVVPGDATERILAHC